MNEKMLTGTLLIIDDMPEYVNILLKFLTRIGFEVLMAYEGQKGLKMAQLHLPDLILLDIRMSGMDGFEVCKHLKSQSITQNIPVIFMTALSDTASKLKGFKLGAADYVTKPLQYEEVLARVNAHLKLHQLQMQIAEQNLQLQISQERYALAATAGKTGVWDWNIQGHEIYLDVALKELLGYGDIELNQWSDWIALIHPSDSERVIEATQEYLQQPESEYLLEYRMLHKEGHIIWVMTRGSLMHDHQGCAYRMVGTTTDITEPQKTEEALKIVHQIFTTVLDSLEAAVYVTDIDTYELLFVNKNTQKLFNHEQPLGKICWQLISNQEQTCPCGSFCAASKLTVDGQITDGYTWEYQNPKTQSWFYIQGRAIDWIDGRVVRLEVATDITQLKQTEKELIQAKDAAEVANRAKTAFLANITHELRTPLNSILGYTQLFQINQTLNQELQEGLTIIQRNGEHLLTLINDILDISKIEANQVKLVPVDFYLEPFLTNISDLFQMRAKQKGIAFHYQPVTPLPKIVHADKIRLRQIMINLLSNAIKFTQTGKVTFKVGLVPTQNVNFQNQKIEFQVEDTGIGIAAEDADNIFLPFQQLGDWKHHSEGSGLGLAISKKLVEMMGGKLHVKSTLKQGSTFWTELHLPIVSNQPPQIIEQQVIIGIEGIVCKILIVDAQKEHRLVLVKFLENLLGFEVIEAETGLEGLKKAQQNKPDAILMELILPDMEGSEAIRQIRQIPQLSETFIIANSTNLADVNQQQCLNAGSNDFLAKPIDTDILLEKLRLHLNLEYIYGNSTTTQQHSDFFETDTSFQPKEDSSIEVFSKLTLEQATTLFNMSLKGDVYGIIEYADKIEQTQAELKDFAIKIKQLAENLEIKAIRHIVKQYTEEASDNH